MWHLAAVFPSKERAKIVWQTLLSELQRTEANVSCYTIMLEEGYAVVAFSDEQPTLQEQAVIARRLREGDITSLPDEILEDLIARRMRGIAQGKVLPGGRVKAAVRHPDEGEMLRVIMDPLLRICSASFRDYIEENWDEAAPHIFAWARESGYWSWVKAHPGEEPDIEDLKRWLTQTAFPSFPLPDTQAYSNGHTPNKNAVSVGVPKKLHRLLIEQVIVRERTLGEGPLTASHIYHRQAVYALSHTEETYLWTQSAQAMTAFLQKGLDHVKREKKEVNVMLWVGEHLWVTFDPPMPRPEGDVAALYVINTSEREGFLAACTTYHPTRQQMAELIQTIEGHNSNTWLLGLVGPRGESVWEMGFTGEKGVVENPTLNWIPPLWFDCPTHTCTLEEGRKPGEKKFQICDGCIDRVIFWLDWIYIAYRMIAGEFRETEEEREREILEVETTRKEPREDKPHLFREKTIKREFRVVRYDASARVPRRAGARGSWVEERMEIDPKSVQWVDINIGKTKRTFRHERWVNVRYQTIDVSKHKKRIPVTAEYVRDRMIVVSARRYEG